VSHVARQGRDLLILLEVDHANRALLRLLEVSLVILELDNGVDDAAALLGLLAGLGAILAPSHADAGAANDRCTATSGECDSVFDRNEQKAAIYDKIKQINAFEALVGHIRPEHDL